MWNIFKTKIPTGQTREVDELESWTVSWKSTPNNWDFSSTYNKVFVKNQDALHFKQSLEDAANLLKINVKASITKN